MRSFVVLPLALLRPPQIYAVEDRYQPSNEGSLPLDRSNEGGTNVARSNAFNASKLWGVSIPGWQAEGDWTLGSDSEDEKAEDENTVESTVDDEETFDNEKTVDHKTVDKRDTGVRRKLVEESWLSDGRGWSSWDYYRNVLEVVNGGEKIKINFLNKKNIKKIAKFLKKELKINSININLSWSRIVPSGYTTDSTTDPIEDPTKDPTTDATNDWGKKPKLPDIETLKNYRKVKKCLKKHTEKFCVPRVPPAGINHKALEDYLYIVTELQNSGIEPIVSLYYWDTPLPLLHEGGWTSSLLPERFKEYSRIVFESALGKTVKYWLTMTEPLKGLGWAEDEIFDRHRKDPVLNLGFDPLKPSNRTNWDVDSTLRQFKVEHNLILAHLKALATFRELQSSKNSPIRSDSQIGIATTIRPVISKPGGDPARRRTTHYAADGWFNRFALETYLTGALSSEYIALLTAMYMVSKENAAKAGTEVDEFDELAKTLNSSAIYDLREQFVDFIGVSYWGPQPIRFNAHRPPIFADDWHLPNVSRTADDQPIVPEMLRDYLIHLKYTYGDPPIMVLGLGYADPTRNNIESRTLRHNHSVRRNAEPLANDRNQALELDSARCKFLVQHLQAVKEAERAGVMIIGVQLHTLIDLPHWTLGSRAPMGLSTWTPEHGFETKNLSFNAFKSFIEGIKVSCEIGGGMGEKLQAVPEPKDEL